VKLFSGFTGRFVPVIIIVSAITWLLSGCVRSEAGTDDTVASSRFFGQSGWFSDTQARWILAGETLLIIFLVALIILLVALFSRYRKTEKRALEAGLRERSLVKENEILDRLNRTKTEFFQNMSHDFKTPLTIISTSVLNAVDSLDYEMDKDEIRESLILAQNEIMRLSRIVDGTLRHAALHSNRQTSESIDLSLLLRKVAKTYHAFLDRNGNVLSISIPNNLPRIYGNSDMLLNVFSNLITNANRFTKNGEINISADPLKPSKITANEQKFVKITVSDTGSGVSPELLEGIFNRGASENSTGLGLSICKTAVEAFGGVIHVESELGKGTKISFTVPIYVIKLSETEEIEETMRRI